MNPEELFKKLIQNKISREEFENLLEGFDDEEIVARYETYLLEQFEKEVETHFSDKATEGEKKTAQMKVTKNQGSKSAVKKGTKKRRDYPIAAVVVLFIGLTFSVLFIISQINKTKRSNSLTSAEIIPERITKSTPAGRRFKMTLQDGSFVHMNSVSRIVYPNVFEDDSREIEMKGEMYFDIHRDEKRPFKIKVKDYSIEVLGTSFGVKAYDDEDEFEVVVESGKVKVTLEEGDNTVILEKDQKLIFNPKTNLTEIIEVESGRDLSWRTGTLSFDHTPMKEVERMVERWYGIDLVITDSSVYKKSLSGDHYNESLKSVLEVIKTATGTEYFVKGNSIILK